MQRGFSLKGPALGYFGFGYFGFGYFGQLSVYVIHD